MVATDATLTKAQAKRLAVMAQNGLARAIHPVHTPLDGDIVFAAASAPSHSPIRYFADRTRHGRGQCAGARGRARRLEATALPFAGALPSWKDKFGK